MFSELPVLGVGVSLSLSEQPDPVSLLNKQNGPQFIEYSGLADVASIKDEVTRIKNVGASVLFHPSYINFCGSFENSKQWLAATDHHIQTVESPWFAQDCAYCFWQESFGYSSQFGYFMPPIFNENSLQMAVERIKEVQKSISVPLAIEPPPFTFVVGGMPLFQFFGELAERADCAILLDMGHLVSYEMASGLSVMDAIESLPCERVVELHVAGGRIKTVEKGDVYIDAHEASVLDQTWLMLDALLPLLPNVKAVCFECEGVGEKAVLSTLEKLKDKVHSLSGSTDLVEHLNILRLEALS